MKSCPRSRVGDGRAGRTLPIKLVDFPNVKYAFVLYLAIVKQ